MPQKGRRMWVRDNENCFMKIKFDMAHSLKLLQDFFPQATNILNINLFQQMINRKNNECFYCSAPNCTANLTLYPWPSLPFNTPILEKTILILCGYSLRTGFYLMTHTVRKQNSAHSETVRCMHWKSIACYGWAMVQSLVFLPSQENYIK